MARGRRKKKDKQIKQLFALVPPSEAMFLRVIKKLRASKLLQKEDIKNYNLIVWAFRLKRSPLC